MLGPSKLLLNLFMALGHVRPLAFLLLAHPFSCLQPRLLHLGVPLRLKQFILLFGPLHAQLLLMCFSVFPLPLQRLLVLKRPLFLLCFPLAFDEHFALGFQLFLSALVRHTDLTLHRLPLQLRNMHSLSQ